MKKPSYRKLKQMLADAETAFRQVQSNNLDLSSEILRLRETVNKLSNDLEHKDRALCVAYNQARAAAADHSVELSNLRQASNHQAAVNHNTRLRLDTAEARVKELEAKLEAVRLVIR